MPSGCKGHPKYTEELLNRAWVYLDDYQEHGHAIPSISGMALVLGVRRETIHQWVKEGKEEIIELHDRLMSKQEERLFTMGLQNEWNAGIVKLALVKHGYHDKVAQENSGPGGKPEEKKFIVEIVDATPNGST